jgi:hypothetical protein
MAVPPQECLAGNATKQANLKMLQMMNSHANWNSHSEKTIFGHLPSSNHCKMLFRPDPSPRLGSGPDPLPLISQQSSENFEFLSSESQAWL